MLDAVTFEHLTHELDDAIGQVLGVVDIDSGRTTKRPDR